MRSIITCILSGRHSRPRATGDGAVTPAARFPPLGSVHEHLSFNGNKIITTSGGGMLVSDDGDMIRHARKLATQAREPAPHYEHAEIGYNYRLSNVLAAIGRGQLRVLDERVAARRRNFDYYCRALGDLPGIDFMPEAPWGRASRWLTCITVEPGLLGVDREAIRLALEAENIEARPVWKPMHLQPVFASAVRFGGAVAEDLFARGICFPSSSSLTHEEQDRVIAVVRGLTTARTIAHHEEQQRGVVCES
jgi:dTDP-4-amino-4,6-dideoxygalactose transaminase